MPDKEPGFQRKLDEHIWLGRMRERDKAGLDPYGKWIASNEMESVPAAGSPDDVPECGLFSLFSYGNNAEDYEKVNELIQICTTPYLILYSKNIRFSPDAFLTFSRVIKTDGKAAGKPDFIYCDEDRISLDGKRVDPFFKPGWSPDTLMSFLYVGKVGVFRTDLLKKVGGLHGEYGSAAYYDLVLRYTERAKRIRHISKILYHILSEKDDRDARLEIRVKEDALRRRKNPGVVEWSEEHQEADVRYLVQGNPLVSIIIPSKDHADMLEDCVRSIQEHTRYARYELIIVDNGSSGEQRKRIEVFTAETGARYFYHPMRFNFSAMCNLGAKAASGEYLLFLNDDITAIQKEWLERMLGQAQLSHVGAVGAKLLYPTDVLPAVIQHDGILNLADGPAHALMRMADDKDWYYHRNRVTYNFSSVTGACLMVSKEKYEKAGGMDERLSIAYNDVALCFRLMELGYQNCVRNDVSLIHAESASRGLDAQSEEKLDRLRKERRLLYREYPQVKDTDPCYNKNLTRIGIDYSIKHFFPEKPCGRMRGHLPSGTDKFHYSLELVQKVGDLWEVTGWVSVGRWAEYSVKRFLVLEGEQGECICFRMNRIRMDDSKLDEIRNREGELFTPFVWFHIFIDQKVARPGERYEIVLVLKRFGKHDVCIRTGEFLERPEDDE